jgi:hypothetical protein
VYKIRQIKKYALAPSANGPFHLSNEQIIFTLQVGKSSVIGRMMIFGSTKEDRLEAVWLHTC